ncbi:M48 family metalloprotease [Gammaproteobacteria bacterium AH-315-C21]|nr:M48 family metalloprotease [Gammaproteobacteria bacterium AH-315-C21]
MSEKAEIKLGRESPQQVVNQFGLDDDPELQASVQKMGEQLALNSYRSDLAYRFTVLDSDQVNAFALPGGDISITRGIMAYLNSEAELAAVLGHEVGHVTVRDGVQQASQQQATGFGYLIGSILVPELRAAGAQNLFNLLGTAWIRGYGREHELEADSLGAEYIARSGYQPIEVVRAKEGDTYAALAKQARIANDAEF